MLLEDNWTCSAEKLRASQRENRLTGGPIAATPVHAFALKTRMRKRRSRSLATISASVVETTSTKESADLVSRREFLNAPSISAYWRGSPTAPTSISVWSGCRPTPSFFLPARSRRAARPFEAAQPAQLLEGICQARRAHRFRRHSLSRPPRHSLDRSARWQHSGASSSRAHR